MESEAAAIAGDEAKIMNFMSLAHDVLQIGTTIATGGVVDAAAFNGLVSKVTSTLG